MIQQVSFRNFKALRDVQMPLERLTVIVGPNSSGKTSILQGLSFLLRLASGAPVPESVFDALRTKGVADPLEVMLELPEGDARVVMLPSDAPADVWPGVEPDFRTPRWVFFVQGREGGEAGAWQLLRACPNVARNLPRPALVRFDASRLAEPHYSEQAIPTLGPDGTGLPSVLAAMALTYPDEFSWLQDDLRKVIPAVQRVRFERVPVHREEVTSHPLGGRELEGRYYVGDSILFDMTGAKSVPAAQASEGTVLVLGLLTALQIPPQPNLLLIDDLGHGLHPRAQWDLVKVLRQVMEQRPDLQIVATTHSPLLLDEVRPSEVRLTALKEDGSVACAAMTEHPDFGRWKGEFSAGEFWSVIGEKWVAGRESVPVEAGS
jgi:energy-coupling factor transporter ATP-binding protein EcfA2